MIKELLRWQEDGTLEVSQVYVLNTFSPSGCMNALPLIWKFPDEHNKQVVIPGPFHTGMNYKAMVTGSKCRGSGYTEILIKAVPVTTSCPSGALKGKAYTKALFCLKTASEAMPHKFEGFVQEENVEVYNPV